MSFQITFRGKQYQRSIDQSILDCLLSNGVEVSNSCRAGICCSCMMKSNSKNIPSVAQTGLKDSLKEQGYFLSCVCKPEEDLEVFDADAAEFVNAEVIGLDFLTEEVIRLRLKASPKFDFKAGQYITLIRKDQLARSYSIASLPQSGYIELHIRVISDGKMSSWIRSSVHVGESLSLRGPYGNCFYSQGKKDQPLLLIGTGTGLAPLYGILKDALIQGHCGTIDLFHGGLNPSSIYLNEELQALSSHYSQFQYRPCVLSRGTDTIPEITLDQYVLQKYHSLKNARIFLCGDPKLVNHLKKKLFLAGASAKEIYADAFLPTAS